jgi:hypothetical protein
VKHGQKECVSEVDLSHQGQNSSISLVLTTHFDSGTIIVTVNLLADVGLR